MNEIFSLNNIFFAIGALVTGGVWAYRAISKHTAEQKKDRLDLVHYLTKLAYQGVNEYARRTESKVDDKVALGLRKVVESLAAAGAAPLSVAEEKYAEQVFDALHFSDKQAARLGMSFSTSSTSGP